MSLLQITGLESRVVTDDSRQLDSFGEIDYSLVNKLLDAERKKSVGILSEMLKQ